MRSFLTSALAISTVYIFLIAVAPASAREYPWCAAYADDHGGRNCGFDTFEQCMAALSGNGGYCERNLFFSPDVRPAPQPRRPVRR